MPRHLVTDAGKKTPPYDRKSHISVACYMEALRRLAVTRNLGHMSATLYNMARQLDKTGFGLWLEDDFSGPCATAFRDAIVFPDCRIGDVHACKTAIVLRSAQIVTLRVHVARTRNCICIRREPGRMGRGHAAA